MLSSAAWGSMHPCLSESSKAQRGGYYNPPSANPALLTGPKADMATLECPASPLTSQAADEKNPGLMIKETWAMKPINNPLTVWTGGQVLQSRARQLTI